MAIIMVGKLSNYRHSPMNLDRIKVNFPFYNSDHGYTFKLIIA